MSEFDADEPFTPPIDRRAWRRVRRGLRLVRMGMMSWLLAAPLSVSCCMPAASYQTQGSFWQGAILVAATTPFAVTPAIIVAGIGLTSFVPKESGAKVHAKASLTLALVLTGMLALLVTFAVLSRHRLLVVIGPSMQQNALVLRIVLSAILISSLTLLVHCWQLFLRALFLAIAHGQLAEDLNRYRWWFSVWAGCAYLALALAGAGSFDSLWGFGVVCGVCAAVLTLPLFIWEIALLRQVEEVVNSLLLSVSEAARVRLEGDRSLPDESS